VQVRNDSSVLESETYLQSDATDWISNVGDERGDPADNLTLHLDGFLPVHVMEEFAQAHHNREHMCCHELLGSNLLVGSTSFPRGRLRGCHLNSSESIDHLNTISNWIQELIEGDPQGCVFPDPHRAMR
jgi:hypothetical protein